MFTIHTSWIGYPPLGFFELSRADFGLALAAFGLLVYGRQSPVLVVALAAMAGWLLAM